jgi:hypothetical protein
VGDFTGAGHDQLLLINRKSPPPPKAVRTCVILCRFNDDQGGATPVPAEPPFYEQVFFGIGIRGSLRDYFFDVAHGKLGLTGQVTRWLNIGHTLAEHQAPVDPTLDPKEDEVLRAHRASGWGEAAAQAEGIDFNDFDRRAIIINAPIRARGYHGTSMIMPHVVGTPFLHGVAAHEFGHALDLWHANSATWVGLTWWDKEYGDRYCIMGGRGAASFALSLLGQTMVAGPGLNGVHANKLGGIPPSRIYIVPTRGADVLVQLAPLTHAEESGSLLIKIPPTSRREETYWVELRDRSGWDRGMQSQSRIVIHQTRPRSEIVYALEINGKQGLDTPGEVVHVPPHKDISIRFVTTVGRSVIVRIHIRTASTSQRGTKER